MGSVIEPIVQGQRTGLSPLAIILSAAFWTLLWGPIGLLLAIPLTVVLVVLGRHVERLEFLNVVLGDTPPLSPPEQFYQRMLAGDPAEAVEQAEKFIKECPLVDYYDEVVIEGLRLAQADADRGTLEPVAPGRHSRYRRYRHRRAGRPGHGPKPATKRPMLDLDATEEGRRGAADRRGRRGRGQARDFRADPQITLSDDWKAANAVLCVASRTALDETVALPWRACWKNTASAPRSSMPSTCITATSAAEDREGVRLICVSALDVRERSAHARFLVRRLKRIGARYLDPRRLLEDG